MPHDLDTRGDPWSALRPTTPARIGLARTGEALTLPHVLDLQLGHARARDAVHVPMNVERVCAALAHHDVLRVTSQAPDRATYLRRPDLGRKIDPDTSGTLTKGDYDVVFVVADGLSSIGAERHAVPVLDAVLPRLDGWHIAPIIVATQARVALADDIGERLGAKMSVILIGERPGLSVADSLGIYLTFDPKPGRRDAERNCISNVHGAGLTPSDAAARLAWLMIEARRRSVTGVALKDESALAIIESR